MAFYFIMELGWPCFSQNKTMNSTGLQSKHIGAHISNLIPFTKSDIWEGSVASSCRSLWYSRSDTDDGICGISEIPPLWSGYLEFHPGSLHWAVCVSVSVAMHSITHFAEWLITENNLREERAFSWRGTRASHDLPHFWPCSTLSCFFFSSCLRAGGCPTTPLYRPFNGCLGTYSSTSGFCAVAWIPFFIIFSSL